jgi:hypothetical protein
VRRPTRPGQAEYPVALCTVTRTIARTAPGTFLARVPVVLAGQFDVQRPVGVRPDGRRAPQLHIVLRVRGLEDRDADPRIALHVAVLHPPLHSREQQVIAVAADPHRGGVRAAIRVDRGQDRVVPPVEQPERRIAERERHGGTVPTARSRPPVGTSQPGQSASGRARPRPWAARPRTADPGQPAGFSHTDTCFSLSLVNGARVQPAHRSRSRIPASWAIRSSSAGHTYRNGIDRYSPRPSVTST